ncbi:MAG TPA: hypothetical protein DCQ64_21945 [Candidatus Rokubacteria bacterium]|nr:hypothetical protein [Candidatus Rokubacteria bacterium]
MTPTIRLATDQDGPAIGKLFAEAEYPDFGVDWTSAKVSGWWLVAETKDGQLVGAVMLSCGQPYGYVGQLIVHPAWRAMNGQGEGRLTGRLGKVAYDLLITAFVALRSAGSQMVVGAIGDGENKALQAIYARHGAANLGTFTLMGRRL